MSGHLLFLRRARPGAAPILHTLTVGSEDLGCRKSEHSKSSRTVRRNTDIIASRRPQVAEDGGDDDDGADDDHDEDKMAKTRGPFALNLLGPLAGTIRSPNIDFLRCLQ